MINVLLAEGCNARCVSLVTFWPSILQALSDLEQVINKLRKPIVPRSRHNLPQQPDNLKCDKTRPNQLPATSVDRSVVALSLAELPPARESKARRRQSATTYRRRSLAASWSTRRWIPVLLIFSVVKGAACKRPVTRRTDRRAERTVSWARVTFARPFDVPHEGSETDHDGNWRACELGV